MGLCFSSAAKGSGHNRSGRNPVPHHPPLTVVKHRPPQTPCSFMAVTIQKDHRTQPRRNATAKKTPTRQTPPHGRGRDKVISNNNKRHGEAIPYGKRIDFGYAKDFDHRYTIGKLLGHGQFGYTYVATDKKTGDRVAVKKIDKAKMQIPIAVEDVKREVKILQALTGHENVVRFYNAFEDKNSVYIVMELCEGGELLDRILARKDSRYSEKDAAVVVRQMLKVAAECHLRGLVHRDMKPENFLFKSTDEDSALKATDFGLSDFIKPGKKFHDIVGSAYYVAPEVLKRRSGPESDVWSIGVISYILLCGRRPFWDKTEDGIFKEVLKNKPDFRRKPWPMISNSAKDFVKKLLVKDPRARLTAAQALSHPWVREGGDASEIPIDISVLNNMRQFVKFSRLKQFALRALATTLDEEELADLRDQFDAIDVDKNGAISLEEMRQALAKDHPWKLKDARVAEILQAIDSNTDGFVDFSEFVAAALHVNQLEEHDSEKWQQRSRAAFEKFDIDGDGYITAEELRMHTGLKGSIEPLLEEADIDNDGKISLHEFRRLLRTASIKSRNVRSPPGYLITRKV
ncbi:PREDICTED: calcium-dependent protein kinase 16 [Camelina sativa]|uniref:non-specific serine/threonine protein kinase n=1 Tax=Camelina sativa TaxID=90675 RepID=A0ABM0XQL7_CAMSA|nr:PREDICTED: calcium-dependent protein kinase 16 [Camelina sativa]